MAHTVRGKLSVDGRARPPNRAVGGWLLAGVLAIAACSATDPVRPGAENPDTVTRAINLSGFPPEFRRGFTDGCTAVRAGRTGAPSGASGQYAAGWRDGFDYCSPQKAN